MSSKHVRPSTWSDVVYLSDKLRDADVEELAATGYTPMDALADGFNRAQACYTILTPTDHSKPMGMVGVGASHFEDIGLIWMLGTDDVVTHGIRFLKDSKPVLSDLFEMTGYRAFYNHTFYKNTVHHHWLKWMGFHFIASNGRFHEFIKLKG